MTEAEERERLRYLQLKAKAASVGPPSAPAEAPSGLEAAGRGGAQGATLMFGDEIGSAIQAVQGPATPWYLKSPLAALAEATSGVPADQRERAGKVDAEREGRLGPWDALKRRYRENLSGERAANAAAREAAPGAYLGGQIVGGLPLAALIPGGGTGTLGRAAATGAGMGAASGLGGSEADLTRGEFGSALADVALGAGLGGVAGAAGYGLAKALAGPGADLLRKLGIGQARKTITGGTKSISQAAAVSDEAAERALREGAIRPGGTTASASERLGVLREEAGREYARIVEALEKAGVVGPQRDALARQILERAASERANSVGSQVPGYLSRIGREVAETPAAARIPGEAASVPARAAEVLSGRGGAAAAVPEAPGFRVGEMGELISTGPSAAPSLAVRPPSAGPMGAASEVGEVIEREVERLGLTQAENIKRALQDQAVKEYTKVAGNTQLGQAKMEAASKVRQAIEDAVEAQAGRAPAEAAAFVPAKQRAGELIEASDAAMKALNSAQNKNAVSLRDLLLMGAGGTPGQKAALLPLSMLARAVGPSTVAAGAYGLAGALPGVAPMAIPLGTALQRALTERKKRKKPDEEDSTDGP